MHQVDINCDLGEGFGNYEYSQDSIILTQVSSCNIACGFHAGDPSIIRHTIEIALENGVAIGAHPGYPDLQGFGRRSIKINSSELHDIVLYQVSALHSMTEALGGKLHHVKLHGALYNDSASEPDLAMAAFQAVQRIDPALKVYGLPGSSHEDAAIQLGLTFVAEAFGDRKYTHEGKLASRSLDGSIIMDPTEVALQAVSFVMENDIATLSGEKIKLPVPGTLCIHGDHPKVLDNLAAIISSFKDQSISISS